MILTSEDHAALTRAYELALRGDRARAAQIADRAATEGWLAAAEYAAFRLQVEALNLRPWEQAPCQILGEPNGDGPAAQMLRRMLAGGFSRFHHDPTEALTLPETEEQL
jgi:hypothetical protein